MIALLVTTQEIGPYGWPYALTAVLATGVIACLIAGAVQHPRQQPADDLSDDREGASR